MTQRTKMSIAEELEKLLKPFEGASNCSENRRKLKIIVRSFIPQLTEEDVDTAITGILGDTDDSH